MVLFLHLERHLLKFEGRKAIVVLCSGKRWIGASIENSALVVADANASRTFNYQQSGGQESDMV